MKIRKISLENLNSLVGEHELDLTAEPIASAGIFAITGPTGAGKSTLLDAITLALYGRAARYDRPNPEDMMSRHQGKCRAEVEFEVKGEIYRAEWTRHRAREKADGKMQGAKRFVYDAAGEVLTQGLGEADDKVEEICGLNYERFMRSALLAQGEFARFLKSKEDERAELLESLTGTEVFSELSEMVFEETSRRVREQEDQEHALGAICPLEPEVREAKQAALQLLEAEQKKLRAAAKELSTALLKADELTRVLASIGEAEKVQAALAEERAANSAQLAQLAQHRAAEAYFPLLARVDDAQGDAARLEQQAKAAVSARELALGRLETGVASAAALVQEWIEEREKALAGLQREARQAAEQSRSLDAWLKANRSDVTLKSSLPELFEKIETLKNRRGQWSETHNKFVSLNQEKLAERQLREAREKQMLEARAELLKVTAAHEEAKRQFDRRSAGKDEGARRVGIERLGNLLGVQRKLRAGETSLKLAREQLESLGEKSTAVAEKRKAAAALLLAHVEHLQTETLRAGLEEHRANLNDGEECPLCGALEHPFAIAGGAGSRTGELKKKVAVAKIAVEKAEADERSHAKQLAELQAKIQAERASREAWLGEVRKGCESLGITVRDLGESEALLKQWNAELAALGKLRVTMEAAGTQVEALRRGMDKLEHDQQSAAASLAKLERQLASEEEAMRKAVRAGEQALADLETALNPFSELVPLAGKEAELRSSLQVRAKLYGEQEASLVAVLEKAKAAEAEEKEIAKELAMLRERSAGLEAPDGVAAEEWKVASIAAMDKALAVLDTASTSATAAAAEREKQVAAAKQELATRGKTLAAKLEGGEFPDAKSLRSVRLDADQLSELTKLEKRLAEDRERLKGRMESLAENLKRLREEEIPEGEPLAAMRVENQRVEARSDVLSDEISTLRAELKADEKNREVVKEQGALLTESREKLKVWQRLNGLIGSADGKKFRRFAQGLSLDVLVRHANTHLERLSERYQLARREGEELGLEIVDLFQASVTRPMASLSGGESFLASLALALGLSDLAGRNVQIDSLFIDEGFGSLDGDTLDEAISALESLRLRDKTVGVISHVELLKERISTQVVVGQDAGGRGRLEVVG